MSSHACDSSRVNEQARWRPDAATFAVDDFERSLLQGRAIVSCGYVILFGLQALVLALLVLQPLAELLMV